MSHDQKLASAKFECFVFQCELTAQMARKFKSSDPDAGHMTRKIGPLYFTIMIILVKNCLESLNRNKVSDTTYFWWILVNYRNWGVYEKVYKNTSEN